MSKRNVHPVVTYPPTAWERFCAWLEARRIRKHAEYWRKMTPKEAGSVGFAVFYEFGATEAADFDECCKLHGIQSRYLDEATGEWIDPPNGPNLCPTCNAYLEQ